MNTRLMTSHRSRTATALAAAQPQATIGFQQAARLPEPPRSLESVSRRGHRFEAMDVGVKRPSETARLILGPADDRYEREARQVAEHVVARMADPAATAGKSATQLSQLTESGSVQRDADAAASGARSTHVPNQETAAILDAQGAGQPLPAALRGVMGSALGADLGSVRIHHDSRSHALNRSLRARAFTVGQDVFFRQGEFDPQGERGQRLLAHELAHTLQQRNARDKGVLVQRNGEDGTDEEELERQFQATEVALPGRQSPARTRRAGRRTSPAGDRPSRTEAMGYGAEVTGKLSEVPSTGLGLADVSWNTAATGTTPDYMEYAASDPLPTSLIAGAPSIASLAAVPQELKEAWQAAKEAKKSWSGPDRNRLRAARRVGTAADKTLSTGTRLYNAASFTGNLAWHGAKLAGNTGVATEAGNFLTVAGQMAPGIGLATGTAGVVKASYQAHKARTRKASLEAMLANEQDDARRQLIEYAATSQRKRANRAGINIASSALQATGSLVSLTGAPAPAGVALSASGTALKYGALGVRKIKQKARDLRERRLAAGRSGVVGNLIDKVFDPDVERSTSKKKSQLGQMTDLLISGRHHDIFEQLGAKQEHLDLLRKDQRTPQEEQKLRATVRGLFKKRE